MDCRLYRAPSLALCLRVSRRVHDEAEEVYLGVESIRATYQISSQGGNLLPNCFSSIMWSCGRVLWVRRRTFDATWARFMSLGPSTTVFLGVRDEGTINSRDTASLKSSLSKYSSTKCTQNYNVSAV